MPHRYSWKAFLRLGLLTIPVRGFNTLRSDRGETHFHQLRTECNSRIRYQKVGPIHGEVDKEQIVSGYE